GTGFRLHIPIEAGLPTTAPVAALVVGDPGPPAAQKAEERVSRRMDHDACVSMPHNDVSWLRARDALKSLGSRIQIFGICIGIGKTRFLVDVVYQMRAVAPDVMDLFPIHRRREHCLAVVGG